MWKSPKPTWLRMKTLTSGSLPSSRQTGSCPKRLNGNTPQPHQLKALVRTGPGIPHRNTSRPITRAKSQSPTFRQIDLEPQLQTHPLLPPLVQQQLNLAQTKLVHSVPKEVFPWISQKPVPRASVPDAANRGHVQNICNHEEFVR